MGFSVHYSTHILKIVLNNMIIIELRRLKERCQTSINQDCGFFLTDGGNDDHSQG
jgi:hypothetical protein